jgi:AraC family transcriptional regulator
MIGVVDPDGTLQAPGDFETLEVKPYTWAIFKSEEHGLADASEKIQEVWKRIFPEWFPTSDYEHAGGPEFEMTYPISEDRFYSEVWIPVVKK